MYASLLVLGMDVLYASLLVLGMDVLYASLLVLGMDVLYASYLWKKAEKQRSRSLKKISRFFTVLWFFGLSVLLPYEGFQAHW